MLRDETIRRVIQFRDDREWRQFHTPKDLAISLSLEAVELLESEVSLSEEDREALLGAITQRPVSKVLNLSPTVHLTAYVRSEPDLYQLKNMIEQVLEEEICACAEGEHL